MPREIHETSTLAVAPGELWSHSLSTQGINRELRPLLRMTFPRDVSDIAASERLGEKLFRSWILLFGVVPVEYDDVVFEELEPGRFLERSTMWTQRVWEHERTIESVPSGSRITDRVRYEPRMAWMGPLVAPIFRTVFRWRHRNLRRLFGTTGNDESPVGATPTRAANPNPR